MFQDIRFPQVKTLHRSGGARRGKPNQRMCHHSSEAPLQKVGHTRPRRIRWTKGIEIPSQRSGQMCTYLHHECEVDQTEKHHQSYLRYTAGGNRFTSHLLGSPSVHINNPTYPTLRTAPTRPRPLPNLPPITSTTEGDLKSMPKTPNRRYQQRHHRLFGMMLRTSSIE